MTLTPNAAIIPTRESELYPDPGVDLIVAETERNGWRPVKWIPIEVWEERDWEEALWDAGWVAFPGDAEYVTDDYFIVKIKPKG